MITEQQVIKTQQDWAEGVVNIGKIYAEGGDYKQTASAFIQRLYGHDLGGHDLGGHDSGEVFFKPTLARAVPFRHNFTDTLSYFVGGDIAEDKGFALRPWQKIRFDDARKIYCANGTALSMGHYFMQAAGEAELQVEFSFAYVTDAEGDLKIKLHHSSLPYEGI